jgi:hypothetical protein
VGVPRSEISVSVILPRAVRPWHPFLVTTGVREFFYGYRFAAPIALG